MSEFLINLYFKVSEFIKTNVTFLMIMCAVLLVLRFVLVTFGFDIATLGVSLVLVVWSFIIDYSRTKKEVKEYRQKQRL